MASFATLPTEIVHDIALLLAEKDLASLRQTCKLIASKTSSEVIDRGIFLNRFDPPETKHVGAWLDVLRRRMTIVQEGAVDFHNLSSPGTMTALEDLRDMVLEADPVVFDFNCKNFAMLVRIAEETNFSCLTLVPVRKTYSRLPTGNVSKRRRLGPSQETYELLQTLQVVLSPLLFVSDGTCIHANHKLDLNGQFALSQQIAYAPCLKQPVLFGTAVNMMWVSHVIKFFVQYARGHGGLDGRFWDHFDALDANEVPGLWKFKLDSDNKPRDLGRVWRGSYSYLSRGDIELIRSDNRALNPNLTRRVFRDNNIAPGVGVNEKIHYPIQTMKLWVPGHQVGVPTVCNFKPAWHDTLKTYQHFQGLEDHGAAMRAASYAYEGIGWDEECFYTSGNITPLPKQNGIPGFSHITMMKYFRDPRTGAIDDNALWAYEGVVLPGGQMIVGRWWAEEASYSAHGQYSGPFVLWNIDESWGPTDMNNVSDPANMAPDGRRIDRRFNHSAFHQDDHDQMEDEGEDEDEADEPTMPSPHQLVNTSP